MVVVPNMTRASMALRTLCGLAIVGAVLVAGFQLRSPWIVLPLGLAFAVLFAIGKWSQWEHATRMLGGRTVALGIAATVPTQCVLVALFYGVGLGLGALAAEPFALRPFGQGDMLYAAWTLGLGALLGVGAHVLEKRAGPDEDYFRALIADDDELPEEARRALLDAVDGRPRAGDDPD